MENPIEFDRKLSAIMFSDILGYSRMMGEDEERVLNLLQEHNEIVKTIVSANKGIILKYIGDAILSSYVSATDAVRCAIAIQKTLAERNHNKSGDERILVRIGIHVGDVVVRDGDVFGDGVNIAARIEPLAEPGGVCISQTVYDMVRARPEIHAVCIGPRELKNIKESVNIYKVLVQAEEQEAAREESRTVIKPRQWSKAKMAVLAAAIICAIGAALWGWQRFFANSRDKPGLAVSSQTAGNEIRWIKIPAGKFQQGCVPGDRDCSGAEQPRHAVSLSHDYWVMAYEVTVAQFRGFCSQMGRPMPSQPDWNKDNHPVVNVSWSDASDFCQGAGGRLPTESEWERAARGGTEDAVFPWGNSASHDMANYGTDKCCNGYAMGKDQWVNTAPVGSFAPNGFGIYDTAGNVWEWCADWYDPNYYTQSPAVDPPGPSNGELRVLRGGAWAFDPYNMRISYRDNGIPDNRNVFLGFRCVRDKPADVASIR